MAIKRRNIHRARRGVVSSNLVAIGLLLLIGGLAFVGLPPLPRPPSEENCAGSENV